MNKQKKCPYCNKIITGRTDKMFCNDRCRNNYYYKINCEKKGFIRQINTKLLKNRGILRTVNPYGRVSVPKMYLEELGFDFSCFTGLYKTKKGKEYFIVYDHAFNIDEEQRVHLVVFYSDAHTVVSQQHV